MQDSNKRVVILACKMIEKEIKQAVAESGFQGEVIWMERGLHSYPDKLREALQEEINKWDQEDTIIVMGYGICGNGLIGLSVQKAIMIVPKFDDCIRMSLSLKANEPIQCDAHTLYYTDTWLEDRDGEGSELLRIDQYVEKYGEKKGMKVLKLMLKNYNSCTFIDTGMYDLAAAEAEVRPFADRMGFEIKAATGTIRAYKKMANGQWDDEFVMLTPGSTLSEEHFADRARVVTD